MIYYFLPFQAPEDICLPVDHVDLRCKRSSVFRDDIKSYGKFTILIRRGRGQRQITEKLHIKTKSAVAIDVKMT